MMRMIEFPLQTRVIYGPVKSRRFGRSLGINVLPPEAKVCTFNCPYCQLGWTPGGSSTHLRWPLVQKIESEFRSALETHGLLEQVTLSGNGEPTLHPDFRGVCRALVRVRDEMQPGLPIVALTNGTELHRPEVVEGLRLLDVRVVKVDAGEEQTAANLNAPRHRAPLREHLGRIRVLEDFIAQTMFARGRVDNTTPAALRAWVTVLRFLRPKSVDIYTVQRVPADPGIRPVPREDLDAIAAYARRRTGLSVEVA